LAHHGQAGAYFLDQSTRLQGVVREIRWGNPHVMLTLDVKGAGGVEQWAVELSSIQTMEQGGIKREDMKEGDEIIVTGNLHRSERRLILPRQIDRPNGTKWITVPVRRTIFLQ
jgi:hypothetical protein